MIDILKKAALAGGEVLQKYFETGVNISFKTSFQDIVTEADIESQKVIIQSIKRLSRGTSLENKIGFLGEEKLYEKGEYMFVIDPLDGTTNFATGINFFNISIALAKGNEVIGAVVYDVSNKKMYLAQKSKGAFKNDKKIAISKNNRLEELVLLASPTRTAGLREQVMQKLSSTLGHIKSLRILGSIGLELCLIAEGKKAMFIHGSAGPWDIAAAKLILEQAGGIMLDWNGDKLRLDFHKQNDVYKVIGGEEKLIRMFLEKFPLKNAGSSGGEEGRGELRHGLN